jgi:hypothetical protein
MLAVAAGDASGKDPSVDRPGTGEPDLAKLHSLMAKVVNLETISTSFSDRAATCAS